MNKYNTRYSICCGSTQKITKTCFSKSVDYILFFFKYVSTVTLFIICVI